MVFLSLALLSSQSMASHVEGEEAGPLTTKLLLLAEQLKNVPASEQAAVVDHMTEIALERNEVLAGQIESDPEAVLLHALETFLLHALPEAAQETEKLLQKSQAEADTLESRASKRIDETVDHVLKRILPMPNGQGDCGNTRTLAADASIRNMED